MNLVENQVILQPSASPEAQRNLKRTVKKKIEVTDLQKYLSENDYQRLLEVADNGKVNTWGVRNTEIIGSRFDQIQLGAEVYFYYKRTLWLKANVLLKLRNNPALAEALWAEDGSEFVNVYIISEPAPIQVPITELDKIKPYSKDLTIVRQLTVY